MYQQLTAAITAHFNPRANTEFQRYLFKQAMQPTPDIDEFYSTLSQLTETCQFAQQDVEIKSQLIFGCRLDKVRDKELSDPDITLQYLLQYARNLTQAHSKGMKGQLINALRPKPKQTNVIGKHQNLNKPLTTNKQKNNQQ